jgi:hypothetical protein
MLSPLPVAKRFFLLFGIAILLVPLPGRSDPAEQAVKSRSAFKDFSLSQVADGQILESRQGASLSPQIEAGQTCFLVQAPPEVVAARILHWNPAGKPGLEVSRHQILPASAGPDAFRETLASIFKSSGGDGGWIATQSKNATSSSCELLVTGAEKKQLAAADTPGALAGAWATLLANRLGGFRDHGAPDFSNLRTALKSLGAGDISGPSADAVYYWEVGDVSSRGEFSEGVSWSDSSGPLRVFDGEYFVTSEYSASLNVSTLWRIDSAYADQFSDQSGPERIASSGMILSSTKKTIAALRQDNK